MPCRNLDFELSAAELSYSSRPGPSDKKMCVLPLKLREDPVTMRRVAHAMLDKEGHQASLRVNLVNFSGRNSKRDEIFAAKLGTVDFCEYRSDTSFTQQMHAVNRNGPPDVVLATYRSAVPVLSAVEGYYTALGMPIPTLGHVDVSNEPIDLHHRQLQLSSWGEQKREAETARLAKMVAGCSVLVIDEYLAGGRALERSSSIAKAAGASLVQGMAGYWYRKIPVTTELSDVSTIRAAYGDFMYDIGIAAAEISVQTNKPVVTVEEIASDYGDFRF